MTEQEAKYECDLAEMSGVRTVKERGSPGWKGDHDRVHRMAGRRVRVLQLHRQPAREAGRKLVDTTEGGVWPRLGSCFSGSQRPNGHHGLEPGRELLERAGDRYEDSRYASGGRQEQERADSCQDDHPSCPCSGSCCSGSWPCARMTGATAGLRRCWRRGIARGHRVRGVFGDESGCGLAGCGGAHSGSAWVHGFG